MRCERKMSAHDKAANRLARKYGTEHRREGVDILVDGKAIEVAVSDDDINTSVSQLNRSRAGIKYMAVPSRKVEQAKEILEGTGIGVMDLNGTIKKKPRGKS